MNDRGRGDPNGIAKISQSDIRIRLQLDEICSTFEAVWTNESIFGIEKFVSQIESSFKSILVGELLAIDFEMRQTSGVGLSLEEYVAQLPKYSPEISDSIHAWIEKSKAERPQVGAEINLPDHVGDYRIVKGIGKGGTGEVYEAVQESLNRPVAIKTLRYPHVTSQLSRFQQEARAVAMLHHANIVEVYGSGIDAGVPYIAMQLIDGSGLDVLIDQSIQSANDVKSNDGRCSSGDFLHGDHGQKNIARIGMEVARAIGHAHEQGVLHRDIKPSNLLIDKKKNVWVSDFGLAKLRNEDSDNTIGGSVVGTLRYVPPEAFSGQWTDRGDIYSLGVTLYELLALSSPFSASDHPQLIKQITLVDREVKPLRQIDASIPLDMETIVSKAMSFKPEDRYQSACEMADELDRYLHGLPIRSRPIPASEKLWRWANRKPTAAALAMLISAVAFIGLPIATWLWLRTSAALEIVEAQRSHATQMQIEAEDLRLDAEASRYSSGMLLANNYVDEGRGSDAIRILDELDAIQVSPSGDRTFYSEQWELDYLKQRLDTSRLTLRGDKEMQVWHVAIRPDQKQIATVHSGYPLESRLTGEVILWNSQTGKKERILKEQGSRVFGCAYSNDGKRLATIGFNLKLREGNQKRVYSRGAIVLWDVETGEKVRRVVLDGEYLEENLHGYGTRVLPGVIFSDDNQHLISWPNPVEVRDIETLETLWDFNGRYAVVAPGNRVLAYTGTALHELDLNSGQEFKMVGRQWSNFANFVFSNDRKRLACKANNRFRIYDSVANLRNSRDIAVPGVYWAAISPDGTEFSYSARKGEIRVQPTSQSDERGSRSLMGHQSTVTTGAYSKDGSWLVTGSVDGSAKVWGLTSPHSKLDTKLMHDRISSISFVDGGEIVFCARNVLDERVSFNTGSFGRDNVLKEQIKLGTTFRAFWPRGDFAFTRDGKLLVAPVSEPGRPVDVLGYAKGGIVGVWDTKSWELLHTIETQLSETVVTAWTPDNRVLAVAGTQDGINRIKFYLVAEGTPKFLGELSPDIDNIQTVALSGDQKLAIGSSKDILIGQFSFAKLPDAVATSTDSPPTGTARLKFNKPKRTSLGGDYVSLDFSPDGDRLAAANFENDLLETFDVDSGELCYQRAGPRKLCCVRYSPCGNRLALSGYDSIVHLCDAEFGYRLLTLNGCNASPGTLSVSSKVVFSPDGRRIATNNWLGEIAFWEIEEEQP